MLRGGVLCKTGFRYKFNQDRAGAFLAGKEGLCYVADGIGGHHAGHRASEAIGIGLADWWEKYCKARKTVSVLEAAQQLKNVLRECAEVIQMQTPEGQYCGSTIVLLWISGEHYLLLSAGDSRCYRVRSTILGAEVRHLGVDDIYTAQNMGDKVLEGRLINAVDSNNDGYFTIQTGKVKKNMLFALCSDGVYRYCEASWLANSLTHAARFGQIERTLKQIDHRVCNHGAPDNYSLVLVRCE